MSEKISRKEIYNTLRKIDVSDHVEVITNKRGTMRLKYLSWAWAWDTLSSQFEASYEFQQYDELALDKSTGRYYTTGRKLDYCKTVEGTFVKCFVTIEGHVFQESLYCMDNANRTVKAPDAALINKTQKRCLAKTIAIAGLGLNLYAGEDLPLGVDEQPAANSQKTLAPAAKKKNDEAKAAFHQIVAETAAFIKQPAEKVAEKLRTQVAAQLKAKPGSNPVDVARTFAATMKMEYQQAQSQPA